MKALNRAIDKFCLKHPRFGLPNLMLYIVIGNAAMYLLGRMDTTNTLTSFLLFDPQLILRGQVWRLITFLFIPSSGNVFYFALSLYFYFFIGRSLEQQWGSAKFSCYYRFMTLITILFGFVSWLCGAAVYLTATYMNLSMFFAFAVLYPEARVLLFFFIPIKVKYLGLAALAFYVFEIVITPFPANLLPATAIISCMIFCWSEISWYLSRSRSVYRTQNSAQTLNFKKEARRARRDQAERGYRHKCEVCGRTDTDHPELEFRYCSRCAGYHCFCQDHINCHEHFKQ